MRKYPELLTNKTEAGVGGRYDLRKEVGRLTQSKRGRREREIEAEG